MTDGPYMVTVGLNPPGNNAATPYAFWPQLFTDMANLHCTWLRFQLSWKNIETPTQGTYNWTALDDAVSHCNAQGINIQYTLRGAPSWALANPDMECDDVPTYIMDGTLAAGFMTQLCNRYNGISGHGLINRFGYNEDGNIVTTANNAGLHAIQNSNALGLYGNAGTAVTTANKIQPCRNPYFAVKVMQCVNPVVKSLMPVGTQIGMMCSWWLQPINNGGIPNTPVSNMYAYTLYILQNAGNLIDFMDGHYYSNAVAPDVGNNQTSTFLQWLLDFRQAAKDAGYPNMPLDVSEFGYQVTTDCTESERIRRFEYLYNQAVRNGVRKMGLFTLDETGTPSQSSLILNGAQTSTYQWLQSFSTGNPNMTGVFPKFVAHK